MSHPVVGVCDVVGVVAADGPYPERFFVVRFGLLIGLLVSEAALAGPALVLASGPEEEALRRGLASNGVAILPASETRAVLDAAAGSGVTCAEGQVDCWKTVASLAGHDTLALLTGAEIIIIDAGGDKRAPRLVPGGEGIVTAVQRALGTRGAIIIEAAPDNAAVVVDGVAVAGGVADGLSVGAHVVEVIAPDHVTRRESITVSGGDVFRSTWALEQGQSPLTDPAVLGPTLFYGGIGGVALGVVVASAMGGVGLVAGGCSADLGSYTPLSCPGGAKDELADTITITGIGIGAAIAAVGGAAIVASVFVE